MTRICLGCVKDIKDSNFIKCTVCKEVCHLLCADTGSKKLTKNQNWICPNCVSKKPKGDNTNTPIRRLDGSVQSSPVWVTQRSQSKIAASSTMSDSNPGHHCLSREDIRDVIRCEIRDSLTKDVANLIKNTIATELNVIKTDIASLKYDISTFKESMQFMNAEFEKIRSEIDNKFELNQRLEKDILKLNAANKELAHRLQEIEQHTRASNIELQCVPEHRTENLVSLTKQLAKTVSFDLDINDIHTCTRVAKSNPSSSRPRSIIVKLRSPLVRDGFLAAIMKFNKSHPTDKLNSAHLGIGGDKKPVYVAEHLSPLNREIHKAARLKAKEAGYKFVWVRGGRVLIRKTESSRSIVIKDLASLETRAFNATGLLITNNTCDPRACIISVRPERGTAKYTCEVSSEGPRFAVDKKSANMTLAVLPNYDPLITSLPTLVQAGENALVNCTSDHSLPAATIDWFVDSEPQEDPLITGKTHVSSADGDGLQASWRTLHVFPDDYPTHRGYLSLRCRATVATRPPHVRSMSVRLFVAARPHISSYMFSKNNAVASSSSRVSLDTVLWTLLILVRRQVPFLVK